MIILAHSTNETFLRHCQKINKTIKGKIYGGIRRSLLNYFTDILKTRVFKNESLFVYNVSVANLLTSFLSRFNNCKIIFHIHDPKPHSGVLNPLIYLIQFLQILISDNLLIFDRELIKDIKKLYLTRNKPILIIKHGSPEYKYIPTNITQQKINFGFFGRHMYYKNVNRFIQLSKQFPEAEFHIFGNGYEHINNNLKNLKITNGYINNDIYYSAMRDMDYIVLPYTEISFSGVLSDCYALNKKMLVSKHILEKYPSKQASLIGDFVLKKQTIKNTNNMYKDGWKEYANFIQKIQYSS